MLDVGTAVAVAVAASTAAAWSSAITEPAILFAIGRPRRAIMVMGV